MADELMHDIVPKHELIPDSEKEELLHRYNVTLLELPKIAKNDPGIRHIDARTGDIIRILRSSPTSGSSFYYRVVVNA